MNLLLAKYETEYGIRRGDKTHVNDGGLPLCRVKYRNLNIVGAVTRDSITQWVTEDGELTCLVCQARVRKMGGAA